VSRIGSFTGLRATWRELDSIGVEAYHRCLADIVFYFAVSPISRENGDRHPHAEFYEPAGCDGSRDRSKATSFIARVIREYDRWADLNISPSTPDSRSAISTARSASCSSRDSSGRGPPGTRTLVPNGLRRETWREGLEGELVSIDASTLRLVAAHARRLWPGRAASAIGRVGTFRILDGGRGGRRAIGAHAVALLRAISPSPALGNPSGSRGSNVVRRPMSHGVASEPPPEYWHVLANLFRFAPTLPNGASITSRAAVSAKDASSIRKRARGQGQRHSPRALVTAPTPTSARRQSRTRR